MGLLLAFAGRYGYHGDELYFVAAGRNLAWGYADQPPLLPALAGLMDTLFPGSVVGLRAPAILLTGLGVVVSALIAREFGGRWRAQTMAAAAYACSPHLLAGSGHILATHMVDAVLWTVLTWLVVRWTRLRSRGRPDDRLLLFAGLVTAVAMQVKFLVPFFWVVLAVAALAVGPRDLLRRPMLWAGAGIAALATVPTLIWQASNGWPQLEMDRIVAGEASFAGGRLTFLPMALEQAGMAVGAAFVLWGGWRLLRSPHLRPYRFLGWTVLGVTLVFLVNSGRPYYVAGLFALCFAAASADIERRLPARSWAWRTAIPIYAASAAFAIQGLPVTPLTYYADKPYHPMQMALEEFGWPEFVDDVASTYRALPPEQRARTTVVTETYWHAAAIDRFGPDRGLPEAFSTGRGAWYFGMPPEDASTTLFVGWKRGELRRHFSDVQWVSTVDNGHRVPNVTQGMPIFLCEGRRQSWAESWPELRHMSFRA
ncbi:glycosyltransferase [Amycolatopsis antarctica]|uniref:Glycosyltransferase n=1 Tax=Amycolatopsis antarctica TaxID=1854586 RepID=A0A263D4R1_9PSEU|nr:glycosyltransferase family 39 protein [Amycolatopsis antarctica]OZM73433.1 glycosyltransferase [Amycolatopsis antarctica]